ncbi:GDP-fucose protein O-fucosyltransferase protein [Actinidia chinensis var. chinensis]|uniref:O-fucosyltransferase family protein n=1 Tax=Actinidia chinensis var. chinensis TaxID=1590841 RepID=A0A2R6QF52_ACTCC|nr:GDP-fucose protein O-fucosyltransferase protein [Actinidia chinensis var. chinensis]
MWLVMKSLGGMMSLIRIFLGDRFISNEATSFSCGFSIADAVVVAKYLGATLVLPDIRGSKPGDKRNFGDVYDLEKFVKSLDGVVRVAKHQPAEVSARNLAVARVPNRVVESHIAEHIEPIFREKGNIRLVTYFPSVKMRKTKQESDKDSVACLATFGTLELQPEVREVVSLIIEWLRTLSRKSDGQFIAVDLRVETLEKKGYRGSGASGTKTCFSPEEIVLFLRKIGFGSISLLPYHANSRKLNSVKEGIMPVEKKEKYLNSETSEFKKVIDFYICSQSDVFVPAISGLFYANVAGKRIASGRTQILVPSKCSWNTEMEMEMAIYGMFCCLYL